MFFRKTPSESENFSIEKRPQNLKFFYRKTSSESENFSIEKRIQNPKIFLSIEKLPESM